MSGVNFFVQLYLLTALAALLALSVSALRARGLLPISAKNEKNLHCALALACLILPFFPSPMKQDFRFEPLKKTEVASTFREFDQVYAKSVDPKGSYVPVKQNEFPAWAFLLLLALLAPLSDLRRLKNILSTSLPLRRVGRVRVVFSEQVASPFSAHWAGKAWVVIPASFSENSSHLRIALAHEIQHHRQRDTVWLYLFFIVRLLTPLHPLRALWLRAVERAQEEACDEALVDQGRVERRDYSRCLLEVAEISVGRGGRVACAANFYPFPDRNHLKRRIENMYQKRNTNKMTAWALATFCTLSLSAAAFASGNWVVDHRVTRAEAEQMAVVAQKTTEFPVVVNEAVLKQLNRYLGTTQGREFVREGIRNMEGYERLLNDALEKRGMPREILAVGMVESKFKNYPASENPNGAAGVWQFIESTARVFGLRVDESVDERLNVELATDAAFRYLKANRLRYNNWLLGILAYNIGEQNLDRAIEQYGTRNPWELLRRGLKTDPDYLPRFMAMLLILKNPHQLR